MKRELGVECMHVFYGCPCVITIICAELVLNGKKRVIFTHGLNAYVTFGLKYIIYGLFVGF